MTYRVYDYNLRDKNGELRPLDFDKVVQVFDMKTDVEVKQKPRLKHYFPGCSRKNWDVANTLKSNEYKSLIFFFSLSENSF